MQKYKLVFWVYGDSSNGLKFISTEAYEIIAARIGAKINDLSGVADHYFFESRDSRPAWVANFPDMQPAVEALEVLKIESDKMISAQFIDVGVSGKLKLRAAIFHDGGKSNDHDGPFEFSITQVGEIHG